MHSIFKRLLFAVRLLCLEERAGFGRFCVCVKKRNPASQLTRKMRTSRRCSSRLVAPSGFILATTTLLLIGSMLFFWQAEAFSQSTRQRSPVHILPTVPSLSRMQHVNRGFSSRHTVNHAQDARQSEEVREPHLSRASLDVTLTMFSDFVCYCNVLPTCFLEYRREFWQLVAVPSQSM